MFGVQYLKVPPTVHVIQYRKGAVVREGQGLSFFYFSPTSTIVHIPLASVDVPFVFSEATADFQEATIQGQLTFRVVDPKRLSSLLDLSVDSWGKYRSNALAKLNERLSNAAQVIARGFTQKRRLADLIVASEALLKEMFDGLRQGEAAARLGIEILDLSILGIKPTPDMAKALQADAREALLRKADEAVSLRRNAAVEQERTIKENELNTEIAVEQKRRQVRETQMQADIAVEEARAALVDQRVANQRKEADAKAHALRATLEPLKSVDWRTLMAASAGASDPRSMMAMAFRDLAENAGKIGQLNITPDLLSALLDGGDGHAAGAKKK